MGDTILETISLFSVYPFASTGGNPQIMDPSGAKEVMIYICWFFKFSGGEKAMSMYIPLFSALYARYLKANKDCPRIITMDEAFAGVDEDNIRDMFKLLKQLDLDYILNSQILWGTYDTVDNLAISELIRENNEKMVTVIRYHWNGQEKVLVDE